MVLKKLIQDKYHRNSNGNIENHYRAKTKVNLVRYADDFIITANSKEDCRRTQTHCQQFLEFQTGINVIRRKDYDHAYR
jgi:RNA-directed DNA polymerase